MAETSDAQAFTGNAGFYLSEARIRSERQRDFWPDRVLTDYFDETLQDRPDATALATWRADTDHETKLSCRELNRLVNLIAIKLSSLGINKGDVVSFQLPNWWQFIAIHLACIRLGAISNPLTPIFRSRELEFMLGHTASRVLIVPKSYRGFDYETQARHLQQTLPILQHILVIDGTGEDAFELIFNEGDEPVPTLETRLQPNDIMKLMFTSGTTGEPKGVMHISNTLLSAVIAASKRLQLDANDVVFMPMPFAHSIGFLYGIMMAFYLGATLVTMDEWDVARAIDLIERHAVTYTFASTPFLLDLVNAPDLQERNLDSLRLFVTSGAPVPRELVPRARDSLNANIVTGWGMTEVGLVTSTFPEMEAAGSGTDGIAMPCSEVRVVDDDGKEKPRGEVGHLQCRGSTVFPGYFKRPDLYTVDEHGWFDSGDLASMDGQGYITMAARDKEIIIRGGENVPVVEVESLLLKMPQIHEAALVAMPDARLGEKGCAFVVLKSGSELTLREMQEFMISNGLTKQYMPERLEIMDALPKTPSGKIQKFVLREQARQLVESV